MILDIGTPNPKQMQFLKARSKYIGFGGARGGGKSWTVRAKAKLLALNYPGIRLLIVRRTYPELINNHIRILRTELLGIARYNDKDKIFTFANGSTLQFMYCARDSDLDRIQGVEYDDIFLDEATQLSEHQIKTISACLRGANDFPKRIYFTMNPGGQGHAFVKRIFIDRKYREGENPEDYTFIQSLVTDNKVLMEKQPDYIKQLEALPPKLRKAWLEGDWDIFSGMYFDTFRDNSDGYQTRQWTHVIDPFPIPKHWNIVRGFDWGSYRPFSFGWYAISEDDGHGECTIYRIAELYGCTETPNEGVKWTDDRIFREAAAIERTHPLLAGRRITGVADPAIWDASRGVSTAETASKYGIYFSKGDHARVAGWNQCRYRLNFDKDGFPRFQVFNTCPHFIRTIPLLCHDEHKVEDVDSDGEDHAADEWRYVCMSRPIKAMLPEEEKEIQIDPLDQLRPKRREGYLRI